jgi:predicted  nucleic acid-binding Zn-ribbon protein
VVRVEGRRFGQRPDRVSVLFDSVEVAPYPAPFSDGALLVTVPLPARQTGRLSVRVGTLASNSVKLAVARPRRQRRTPGAESRALFDAIDHVASLTAAAARAIRVRGGMDPALAAQLAAAADALDDVRAGFQRAVETWLSWVPLQATATFEPLRTIALQDEMIARAGLTARVREMTRAAFGPGGPVDRVLVGGTAAMFGGRPPVLTRGGTTREGEPSIGDQIFDVVGFVLHEISKAVEGVENILKIFIPSVEGGGGIVVVEGAIDTNVSIGEGVSSIAKLIDIVAQLFSYFADNAAADALRQLIVNIRADIARVEEKSDRQGITIADLAGQIDLTTRQLGGIEEKADVGAVNIDLLLAAHERLEEKIDRMEVCDIRIEAKLDSAQQETARLEEKADRAADQLEALAIKAEVAQETLDQLTRDVARLEAKIDRVEEKSDRAESKLDRVEPKLDGAEAKLDRAEAKLDRAEAKLDRLEAKQDLIEVKLDRLPVVLPPEEGTVAAQRGGGSRVTAAVAVVRNRDNVVFLRAAIDVDPSRLDDLAAWSPWVSFGQPVGTVMLTSVSVDLQYADGSNQRLRGLLSARDARGRVYHRDPRGATHAAVIDPAQWSDWQTFLEQP